MDTEEAVGESQQNATTTKPFVGQTYHNIEYCLSAGIKFNAIPFTYDRANLRCDVKTTSPKFIIWTATMLVPILIELSQIVRELVRAKLDKTTSRGEWCLVAFLFFSWLFMTIVHVNVFLHPYDIVNHLNQLVRMRKWFGEEKLLPSKEHKIVRTQLWFCFFQFLVQASMISAEREKGQFFYSYLPAESRSVATTALWTLYAFFRVSTNFMAGLTQYFVGILHIETCNQIMQIRLLQSAFMLSIQYCKCHILMFFTSEIRKTLPQVKGLSTTACSRSSRAATVRLTGPCSSQTSRLSLCATSFSVYMESSSSMRNWNSKNS